MIESDAERTATEHSRRNFLATSLAAVVGGAVAGFPGSAAAQTPERSPEQGSTAQPLRFFPGFEAIRIDTSGAVINGVKGGQGPPLLLLHGYPQTHLEWHRIAPRLAEHFTVVATDLRGYGDSSKPGDGENHAGYSKRAMALDQVEVMRSLGFDRFALVGHDRGGRVAHRLALDHPGSVSRLAVLDIVPTFDIFSNVTKELATAYYHWFFLIQPAPLPERLYGSHADFILRDRHFRSLIPHAMPEEVYREYLRCFSDPATLHAMCEDYRAAATIDLEHDAADRGTKIQAPLLAIWGRRGAMERLFDVEALWRDRAVDVRGVGLPGGHWLPEELPEETYAVLMDFLQRSTTPRLD
jgi:haloacetate dehalogenase